MSRRRKYVNHSSGSMAPAQTALAEPERAQVGKADDAARLQAELSDVLKQLEHMRKEYQALEDKKNREIVVNGTVYSIADVEKLRQQQKETEYRFHQLQYRLSYLENRYNALANSKLGRLTLHYWANQKGAQNSRVLSSFLFLFKWMFNRLPAVKVLPETEDQSAGSTTQEQETASDVQASSTSVPAVQEAEPLGMPKSQEEWALPYLEKIKQIPNSNGCRYYEPLALRVGIVCDEFFYDSINAAANFIYLTPENWKAQLEQGLDVMLFVSAWHGLGMEWNNLPSLPSVLMGEPNPVRKAAMELLEGCRAKGVPTIFYSKEDPPDYELFVDFAKVCDYVFTSAKECIPYYQESCGHTKVESICFGINPLEHNPIGCHLEEKEDTVLFSGSWMVKYPERCKELSSLFDGVLASGHGLHIIDRNYPGNPRYRFPAPYFEHSSPALGHGELQKVHKLFDWAININSVKGSETMFANRSFELQANGILMLSNFSLGVNNLLPNVQLIHNNSEVAPVLDAMTPEERYERQMIGVRSVFSGHTCFDRLAQLISPTGLSAAQPVRRVLVLADAVTEQVRKNFQRQSYQEKELMEASKVTPDILAAYDMVAWFAPDAYYGGFYLEDLVNAFKYTACDYITKDAWYEGGRLHSGTEHNYVSCMKSKYRTLFWREAYDAQFLLAPTEGAELPNGYSIDHFQYDARPVKKKPAGTQWRLSVIVPVYNNGMHLYGKAFCSLRRSSVFSDMEILLVDDGSTDTFTLRIEEELAEQYPNVRLYQFKDGGSGSASRPRNKGVELATAPYLAFLDPDDEGVCDGYARLLEVAEKEDRDLVVGNDYKLTATKATLIDGYARLMKAVGTDTFDNGFGNTLEKIDFNAFRIHSMVIRTQMMRDNHMEQIIGAVGEDTLLSWQLCQSAKRLRFLNLPIQIYYAETAGSVTNCVGKRYFEMLLKVQQPKADWLVSTGLMEKFMAWRYNFYTTGWVFFKLAQAQDIPACAELVEQMLDVFAPYYNGRDKMINSFTKLCKKGDYTGAAELIRNAYPLHEKRPMLTLEELAELSLPPIVSKFTTTYHQDGSTVRMTNQSGSEGDSYAWIITTATGAYKQLHSTKFSKDRQFCYDFSALQPGSYRVYAYLLHEGQKTSDDVAVFRVYEDKTVELRPIISKAKSEEELAASIGLTTTYRQNGSAVQMTNLSGSAGDSYAWLIVTATGAYKQLHSTKFSKDCHFRYDFSALQPGSYRVRAFLLHEGEKTSDYVAVFRVNEDKTVALIPEKSKTKPEEEPAVLTTTYRLDGSTVQMTNHSGGKGDSYAWLIVTATGAYKQLHSTKFSKDCHFRYDFSALQPGSYRVRAFLLHEGEKTSDYVAVFRVNEDKTVALIPEKSKTKREESPA